MVEAKELVIWQMALPEALGLPEAALGIPEAALIKVAVREATQALEAKIVQIILHLCTLFPEAEALAAVSKYSGKEVL